MCFYISEISLSIGSDKSMAEKISCFINSFQKCQYDSPIIVILTYITGLKPVLSHKKLAPRYVHKQSHKKIYI